jgi:carbamate kinase
VAASPTPRHILEIAAVEALLDAGVIVIALGGGGVPVAFTETQQLIGLEAVIDKDLSSSVLAREIGASTLIMLTDIDCVYVNFLSPRRRPLRQVSVAEAEEHLHNGEFLPGSMAPKIEAGIAFLRAGGQRVFIGLPEELPDLIEKKVGTTLFP